MGQGLVVVPAWAYPGHMNDGSYEGNDLDACATNAIHADAVARVRAHLPDDDHARAIASIFAAVADPTRLRMLMSLRRGELCVCDLAEIADISQSGASHQLRVLRDLQLVSARREGKLALYRLADDHVASLIDVAAEHAAEGCAVEHE